MENKKKIKGGSNMTGTDLYVNKPQSVPVIFEPPCISLNTLRTGLLNCLNAPSRGLIQSEVRFL